MSIIDTILNSSFTNLIIIGSYIFGGCCRNLFTLAQFLFISCEGLFHNLEFPSSSPFPRLKKRTVPAHRWFFMVLLFFTVSVLNNIALGYNISVPLHIIFRSGGLIVSLILGWAIGKRYSIKQVIAVVMVTMGVICATISSAKTNTKEGENSGSMTDYVIGITLLSIALVLSSFMGLYQEVTYVKYGSNWREGLFYTHFLALPLFLIFYSDIKGQILEFNQSIPLTLDEIFNVSPINIYLSSGMNSVFKTCTVPRSWAYLIMNILTQYFCVGGVHRLNSIATALTLNLVLNLRKFTSLVISVWLFDNDFHIGMAIGGLLVFFGTLLYSFGSNKNSSSNMLKKKEDISVDASTLKKNDILIEEDKKNI
ncbi:UAA transporter [Rhizophagus irregularis]|uniref:UAA transporter n=1 Tax=Rhizophagus irregularis TaxID=588596 RepID=A0A2I1G750_9GLOM|nr:UAA transporter [Rhizophagus irregularis]PKY42459.1 UAA transporter [Rhizophagus irregularis]